MSDQLDIQSEPEDARVETLVLRSAKLATILFQSAAVRGSFVFTAVIEVYAEYHTERAHRVPKKTRAEYMGRLNCGCIMKMVKD